MIPADPRQVALSKGAALGAGEALAKNNPSAGALGVREGMLRNWDGVTERFTTQNLSPSSGAPANMLAFISIIL